MTRPRSAPWRGTSSAAREGFELVGEASSGEESLTLIDQQHPDLVLMDIGMGAMSGIG